MLGPGMRVVNCLWLERGLVPSSQVNRGLWTYECDTASDAVPHVVADPADAAPHGTPYAAEYTSGIDVRYQVLL